MEKIGKERDYLENEFIKETNELAFLQIDNINPNYIEWLEKELYKLKQVKNNRIVTKGLINIIDSIFDFYIFKKDKKRL
tara:strand:+ start:178 stop:414 length:237 start_codon:yes stop_codon:yes gene_type:complete